MLEAEPRVHSLHFPSAQAAGGTRGTAAATHTRLHCQQIKLVGKKRAQTWVVWVMVCGGKLCACVILARHGHVAKLI